MQRFLIIVIALFSIGTFFAPTLHAQDTAQTVTSASGRVSVTLPAGWVSSAAVQTDIQRLFASEALALAQDQATLDAINFGPDIGGSHVVIALFPTLEIYPLNPNPFDFAEVATTLFGADNPNVEQRDISGFPAAILRQPNGISFTLVGMGASILTLSAQSINEAGTVAIEQIINSLAIQAAPEPGFWSETPTEPLTTPDGRVTFNHGIGWYYGTRGTVTYASPLPSAVQDFSFNLMDFGPLQAPFFAIIPRSYSEFFAPDAELTPRDLQTILDITLSEINAFPEGGFSPVEVSGFSGVATITTLGDNTGAAVAIDAQHTIYVYISFYPAEQAATYAPIADAVLGSIQIEPLDPAIAALPAEGLREGYRAPSFSTALMSGEDINLRDYEGSVVMLNFWFTTCPPCQTEMPAMQRVYDQYHAQGFEILAVNNREIPAQIQPFLDDFGLTFPVALDIAGTIQQQYGIFNYPTSIFIDRSGVIYAVQLAPMEDEQLIAIIEQGLARP